MATIKPSHQRGFGLIEVLVAVVILGAAVLALASITHYVSNLMIRQQTKWTAERIATTVIELASLPATIRSTVSQSLQSPSREFFLQLRGRKLGPHHGPWIPLALNLPFVDVSSTPALSGGPMTGTVDFPMRYNLKGQGCDMELSQCPAELWPIEVLTWHRFSCPPLYHKTYNSTRPVPGPFIGPIYPTGLVIPAECRTKSQVNIQIVIRESVDAGGTGQGLFHTRTEVISIPAIQVFQPTP